MGKDVSFHKKLDGTEASAPQVGKPKMDAKTDIFIRGKIIQRMDAPEAETET